MPISSKIKRDPELEKEMNRIVECYNYSNQDYAHPQFGGTDDLAMWGGEALILKAKERRRMPFYLARHIAQHLCQRELRNTPEYLRTVGTAKEIYIEGAMIEAEMKKAIKEVSQSVPAGKSSVMQMIESLNEEEAVEEEKEPVKTKRGRPKRLAAPVESVATS